MHGKHGVGTGRYLNQQVYIATGIASGGPAMALDQLARQTGKETFCHGVAIGIAYAAH
jgi:hypothetical protein